MKILSIREYIRLDGTTIIQICTGYDEYTGQPHWFDVPKVYEKEEIEFEESLKNENIHSR